MDTSSRDAMSGYSFSLETEKSPTYYLIAKHLEKDGWQHAPKGLLADISETNFQLSVPAMECLEYKHHLASLVAEYCPHVMPLTYHINDSNWPMVLNQILCDGNDAMTWILKPALMNNGQHINIFQHWHQVESHYLSSNRLGGEHVLQQYISDPHLLRGPVSGHKYSIRMFVVITNYDGAYLYPKGYFNVALQPYQKNEVINLSSHLTNEHLSHEAVNVVQIPTQQYELFKPFYPQIKAIAADVVQALQIKHPFIGTSQPRALSLFGFDFMVDALERVWLLEANHGPCFPINDDHPLQKILYDDFWQALLNSFMHPIGMNQAMDNIAYEMFDKLLVI